MTRRIPAVRRLRTLEFNPLQTIAEFTAAAAANTETEADHREVRVKLGLASARGVARIFLGGGRKIFEFEKVLSGAVELHKKMN